MIHFIKNLTEMSEIDQNLNENRKKTQNKNSKSHNKIKCLLLWNNTYKRRDKEREMLNIRSLLKLYK